MTPQRTVAVDQRFQKAFGTSLSRFWHPFTGFDIVGFDDKFIHSEDTESIAQAIRRKHGPDAEALVRELL